MASAERKIAVAIATCDRPESCRRLVDALLEQCLADTDELHVFVVDNAPCGSGLSLPDDPRITQVHEPESGIPFARNRGVREALPWADIIAFIDDDEVPSRSTWLATLVMALDEYDAEVATGPVEPMFHDEVPTWVQRHPVFHRRMHRTGETVREAFTHNAVVRVEVFRRLDRWFDERLRFTGGSDTELFRRVHATGCRLVWVADAPVREFVAAERSTSRWIVRRSFRIGANRVQRLRITSEWKSWGVLAIGVMGELVLGLLASAAIIFGARALALRGVGRAARALGSIATAAGIRFDEYRHV